MNDNSVEMYVYNKALEDNLPYIVLKRKDRKFSVDSEIHKFGLLSQCFAFYTSLALDFKDFEEVFIVDDQEVYHLINHGRVSPDYHLREAVKEENRFLYGE